MRVASTSLPGSLREAISLIDTRRRVRSGARNTVKLLFTYSPQDWVWLTWLADRSVKGVKPWFHHGDGGMNLQDSFRLFSRFGIDVPALSRQEFTTAYFELAKRYHPDIGNQPTHDLMANINAARANVLRAYLRI